MPHGTGGPVQYFQFRAVLWVLACGCSTAESRTIEFSDPPAVARPDHTVRIAPSSRPYVVTQTVKPDSTAAVVRAPARVAFRDGAVSQVGVPVAGRVTEIHVKTGDRVKAGDPLITLSSPDAASARAASAAAIAEHEAAKREVARQDAMAASGVGVETERASALTKLRQSEAELARAQTTASLLGGSGGSTVVLRAPIDGTVLSRRATVGTTLQPGGDPLIEIGNPTALWAVADVFERDVAQIREGSEVDVELSTRPKPLHGRVASVGTALTGSLRTAPVYITLDDDEHDVRAGMFARAAIKGPANAAIVLPAEAVLVKEGKTFTVYIERTPELFEPREVRIGPSVDGKVQILSGLVSGDRVVVKGALLLDGAAEQLL